MSLSSTVRRLAGCNLLLTAALAPVLGLSAGPAHANSYGSVTACTEDKGGSTQVTLPFKNAIRSLLATTQYGSQGYFQISAGSQLLTAGFVANSVPVVVEHVALGSSFAVNSPIGTATLQVQQLSPQGTTCVTISGE